MLNPLLTTWCQDFVDCQTSVIGPLRTIISSIVCVCAVLFLILYDSTGVLHDFTVLYHLFFVWSGLVWCMGQVPDWEGLFEVLDSDGSGTLAWDELREGRWPSFSVL